MDDNWKCERCGRCREGDFANCKNRQYRGVDLKPMIDEWMKAFDELTNHSES